MAKVIKSGLASVEIKFVKNVGALLCATCFDPDTYYMSHCPKCGDDNLIVVENN